MMIGRVGGLLKELLNGRKCTLSSGVYARGKCEDVLAEMHRYACISKYVYPLRSICKYARAQTRTSVTNKHDVRIGTIQCTSCTALRYSFSAMNGVINVITPDSPVASLSTVKLH